MNNTTPEQLSKVLIDVRKAYRLLYFYQRRVLDTVKYISDLLSVSPVGGYPIFSDLTPRSSQKPQLDNWAWDWLNMYMYEFYYGSRIKDGQEYFFGIQIQSDTGCYDAGVKETDVQQFSEPELAGTRILFVYGKNRWKGEKQAGHEEFVDFHDLQVLSESGGINHIERDASGERIFLIKACPLEDFIDEAAIKSQVEDFLGFLAQEGVAWGFG